MSCPSFRATDEAQGSRGFTFLVTEALRCVLCCQCIMQFYRWITRLSAVVISAEIRWYWFTAEDGRLNVHYIQPSRLDWGTTRSYQDVLQPGVVLFPASCTIPRYTPLNTNAAIICVRDYELALICRTLPHSTVVSSPAPTPCLRYYTIQPFVNFEPLNWCILLWCGFFR